MESMFEGRRRKRGDPRQMEHRITERKQGRKRESSGYGAFVFGERKDEHGLHGSSTKRKKGKKKSTLHLLEKGAQK